MLPEKFWRMLKFGEALNSVLVESGTTLYQTMAYAFRVRTR